MGCYLLKGTASKSTQGGWISNGMGFCWELRVPLLPGLGVSAERCFPLLSEPGCVPVPSSIAQGDSSPLEKLSTTIPVVFLAVPRKEAGDSVQARAGR